MANATTVAARSNECSKRIQPATMARQFQIRRPDEDPNYCTRSLPPACTNNEKKIIISNNNASFRSFGVQKRTHSSYHCTCICTLNTIPIRPTYLQPVSVFHFVILIENILYDPIRSAHVQSCIPATSRVGDKIYDKCDSYCNE